MTVAESERAEPTVSVNALIDLILATLRQQRATVAGIDPQADRVLEYRVAREFNLRTRHPLQDDETLLCDAQRLMRSRSAHRDEIDAVMRRLRDALSIEPQGDARKAAA